MRSLYALSDCFLRGGIETCVVEQSVLYYLQSSDCCSLLIDSSGHLPAKLLASLKGTEAGRLLENYLSVNTSGSKYRCPTTTVDESDSIADIVIKLVSEQSKEGAIRYGLAQNMGYFLEKAPEFTFFDQSAAARHVAQHCKTTRPVQLTLHNFECQIGTEGLQLGLSATPTTDAVYDCQVSACSVTTKADLAKGLLKVRDGVVIISGHGADGAFIFGEAGKTNDLVLLSEILEMLHPTHSIRGVLLMYCQSARGLCCAKTSEVRLPIVGWHRDIKDGIVNYFLRNFISSLAEDGNFVNSSKAAKAVCRAQMGIQFEDLIQIYVPKWK